MRLASGEIDEKEDELDNAARKQPASGPNSGYVSFGGASKTPTSADDMKKLTVEEQLERLNKELAEIEPLLASARKENTELRQRIGRTPKQFN